MDELWKSGAEDLPLGQIHCQEGAFCPMTGLLSMALASHWQKLAKISDDH